MQQQIHSYAFQLGDDLHQSILEPHPKQSFFYAGANLKKHPNKSIFYRLHFNEQQPKKSQIISQSIDEGNLLQLYSFSSENQQGEENLFYITNNSNESQSHQLSKAKFPLLEDDRFESEIVFKNDQPFQLLENKQTLKKFIIEDKAIYQFGNNEAKYQKGEQLIEIDKANNDTKITYCTVDPIHEFLTYVTNQSEIHITDKSLKKEKYSLKLNSNEGSHTAKTSSSSSTTILSIDYNPNKQYYLMSTHLQCLKFWDIRKPSLPISIYNDHHSLILNSQYNPSHDQLITCSYDDGTVGLLRISSVSSSPNNEQIGGGIGGTTDLISGSGSNLNSIMNADEDCMVKLYDEHEDSVYRLGWSGFSPWIWGSLSYSAANLVVNYVPSVEKYRILL